MEESLSTSVFSMRHQNRGHRFIQGFEAPLVFATFDCVLRDPEEMAINVAPSTLDDASHKFAVVVIVVSIYLVWRVDLLDLECWYIP